MEYIFIDFKSAAKVLDFLSQLFGKL
jgi:hypothetical protein